MDYPDTPEGMPFTVPLSIPGEFPPEFASEIIPPDASFFQNTGSSEFESEIIPLTDAFLQAADEPAEPMANFSQAMLSMSIPDETQAWSTPIDVPPHHSVYEFAAPTLPSPAVFFGASPPAPAPQADHFDLPTPVAMGFEATFNAAWEKQLSEKAGAELKLKQELKESAEKYLDEYHNATTDKKLSRMERNRKAEEEAQVEKDLCLQEARRDSVSQWRRVFDLVEKDVIALESEKGRMHKLLINLKNKGTMHS